MASEREIEIVISAKDEYTKQLRKASVSVDRFATKSARAFLRAGKSAAAFTRNLFSLRRVLTSIAAGAAAGYGISRLANLFISAGSTTEQLQVRLSALLGTQEEGARLFQLMSDFAGKVPFEYREIMEASTQLAGIMKGGADQIRSWMPLIGDVAAVAGVSIGIATEQVVRMLSSGAQAAEIFKEKGTLSLLGFQSGVSYTAEETRKKIIAEWEKTGSRFRGVTDELAKTWAGKVSMLKDAWFQFKDSVAKAGFLDFAKESIDDLLRKIENLKSTGKLDQWAEDTNKALVKFFDTLKDGMPTLLTFVGGIGWLMGKTVAFSDFLAKMAAWATVNSELGAGVTIPWAKFGVVLDDVGKTLDKTGKKTIDLGDGLKKLGGGDGGGGLNAFQKTIDDLAQSNLRLGKSKEEVLALDAMEAINRGASHEQVLAYIQAKQEEFRVTEALSILKAEEAERELNALSERPDVLTGGQTPEIVAEVQAFQTRKDLLTAWHDEKFAMLVLQNATEEELQQAHEDRTRDMDSQTNQMKLAGARSVLSTTASIMDSLMTLVGSKNKAMFNVMKAFAIAETTISTIESAQSAYASAAKIPYVGFILAPIAAAAAVASGLARVAQIKSMKPGGSGSISSVGGGGVVGGAGAGVSAPGAGVPTFATEETRRPLNVIFNIHTLEGKDINLKKLWGG